MTAPTPKTLPLVKMRAKLGDHIITAGELIELLSHVSPDSPVILQRDSEGNGYSPLAGADDACAYCPDSTWSGEVKPLRPDDFEGEDEDEEFADDTYAPCVVLFPVN